MNAESPVWFITGCSSGLGRALAERVLARGHRVVASARSTEPLASLARLHPENCRTLALDVTAFATIKQVFAVAAQAFGRVDVVVNNAGGGLLGAVEEVSDMEAARNFDLNFFGPMQIIRAALPAFRAQRSGHFVNISAAAAISNYAGFSIYGAAKCALEGLSEALAAEVKPLGIHVTVVQPGPFRTDFISRSLVRAENRVADYEGTRGKFAKLLDAVNGRQPGDPARAADAIIAAVESGNPPLRLVLGKYAREKVLRRNEASARELADWQHIGLPVELSSST